MLSGPLDLTMANKFREGLFRGYVVVPLVIGQWKVGDWRDTDIQISQTEEKQEDTPGSWSEIVGSVRTEIATVFKSRNVWKQIEDRQG